jgi:AcrR family transcriptional regulator
VTASGLYHHGDLRRALLDAAAEEIDAVGVSALSLRELARRTGVSHAAPAHHFGDKTGLFTALAAEGFRLLHEQTAPGLQRSDALVQAGIGYLRFAVAHPAHFTVMYQAHLLDLADAELIRESSIASEVLREAVRRATGARREPALTTQTTAAWAVVHGLATLWISGNLPYERTPEARGESCPSVDAGTTRNRRGISGPALSRDLAGYAYTFTGRRRDYRATFVCWISD